MTPSPRRWNRTTLILISYGFDARPPDHWRSSGRHYKLVVSVQRDVRLSDRPVFICCLEIMVMESNRNLN
ncbi:hypothetical protein CEXT_604491 [Caerostris extrusa]|uniref:Ycf15 n=1 Tax=Caerostris extrusa TaxID=172846 RepID=A0AAV4RH90_CAEEX|nr:hypothetical protein CEXT_604491 [Caerostris extrusa]